VCTKAWGQDGTICPYFIWRQPSVGDAVIDGRGDLFFDEQVDGGGLTGTTTGHGA